MGFVARKDQEGQRLQCQKKKRDTIRAKLSFRSAKNPGFPGGADDRIREFSLAGGIWHGRADGLQVGQDARVLGGE